MNQPDQCSQIFPRVHCEKTFSPLSETGLMINWALVSHVAEVNGQHGEVVLQPLVHCLD